MQRAIYRMIFLLALFVVSCVSGHYVWQRVDADLTKTSLTFGEKAGQPGLMAMTRSIVDISKIYFAVPTDTEHTSTVLNGTLTRVEHDKATIDASLPSTASAPLALESFVNYGLFSESDPENPSLLQYYTTAPVITTPNDWFSVQDLLTNTLEITLRDPYMTKESKRGMEAIGISAQSNNGDQCPPGQESVEGDACVVAVVRFKQQLIKGLTVSTFDSKGEKLSSDVPCDDGVVILRVPMDSEVVYAAVNYREAKDGSVDGTDYSVIDHWATTSMVLQR